MTGPKPGGGSDTPWAERGACVGHPEPDLWHPVSGGMTKAKAKQIRDAKTICAGCEVRVECLTDAMENGRDGIWGGLLDDERRRLRRRSEKAARKASRQSATRPTCSVPDCGAEIECRGWCNKHYLRWRTHGDPLTVTGIRGDDRARFWSKVAAAGPDECWLWNGPVNNMGYGRFLIERGGRRVRALAHRQAMGWHLDRQLDPAEVVMHSCDTPRCVNVNHLRIGTQAENLADMRGKGRHDETGLAMSPTRRRNLA